MPRLLPGIRPLVPKYSVRRTVANASARDIGRTTGTVAGNVAVAVAPGAALSKIAALGRLRMARPRATYDPPQIGRVREVTKFDKPWKPYNDAATDTAVKMMEALGGRLEEMDKGFLRELVDAFPVMAEGYSGEAQQVVRDIPYGFYLEEVLAADDPIKLAELEAARDTRD